MGPTAGFNGSRDKFPERGLAAMPIFFAAGLALALTLCCLSHRWARWPSAVPSPRRNEPSRRYLSFPGAPLGVRVWVLTQKWGACRWPWGFGIVPEATFPLTHVWVSVCWCWSPGPPFILFCESCSNNNLRTGYRVLGLEFPPWVLVCFSLGHLAASPFLALPGFCSPV